MPNITLPLKAHSKHQLKLVEKHLKSMVKGLKVDTKISKNSQEWIQISTSGEDREVATHFLREKMGEIPTGWKQIKKDSTYRGYISTLNKRELRVDIGANIPEVRTLLKRGQNQLVNGRKKPLKEIADWFGLSVNLPLPVKICKIKEQPREIEGKISEKRLNKYRNWTKALLDRLIVLGASTEEVKRAIKKTRSHRDIIDIGFFSFLEHSLVCKLGTDAAGLIPKIGRKLPNTKMTVFNPKKIMKFLGDYRVL